eukprot:4337343-Lingulodinium_polyedra.AAC.1
MARRLRWKTVEEFAARQALQPDRPVVYLPDRPASGKQEAVDTPGVFNTGHDGHGVGLAHRAAS